MATKSEKSERRWMVIKAILWFLLGYSIAVFALLWFHYDVSKLDVMTGAVFGSSVIGIVGHWMTTPTGDD